MLFDPALVTPELVLPASAELGGPLVRRVLARGPAPRAAVVLLGMITRYLARLSTILFSVNLVRVL